MPPPTLCLDLDGVLCSATAGDYKNAQPIPGAIAAVNRCFARGCRILIHTSRFMGRSGGDAAEARRIGYAFTQKQLAGWGVQYHELHLGKPVYDLVIDDRSLFYRPNWPELLDDWAAGPPAGSVRKESA